MTGGYVEKSFAPAPADLEAIGAFTRRAFAPEELYVFSVVLCNNDVDRDHEKFTRRALEELGALFVGKTGIFDHSMKKGAVIISFRNQLQKIIPMQRSIIV